jgi:HD-like signal output (HDOD) protein
MSRTPTFVMSVTRLPPLSAVNLQTMTTNLSPVPQIDRAQISKAATAIGILGSGAHGAPRILASICKADVTSEEISSLLAKEPSLYARVLRVANSPYYGQSRSISSVDRALVLLGLSAVRGIAAAACLDRTLARDRNQQSVDLKALMQHSHATAVAAKLLAETCRPTLASEAFIAGLLHNLGIVVQIHLDSAGIDAVVKHRKAGDEHDIRILETDCCTVGHEECVAVIFEAWQMPESLLDAARFHHHPVDAPLPHQDLASLVNLGATLALAAGSTYTLEPFPTQRCADAVDILNLTDDQLDGVSVALPERLSELSAALRA